MKDPTSINLCRFPTISKLVKSVLSLPHSNAEVERLFSQVTLIKTRQRNKLKTKTLDALLMAKHGLPSTCFSFVPDQAMYSSLNSSMYDSDNESD